MAKGFLDGYKTYDTSQGFGSKEKWRVSFKTRMTREEAAEILGTDASTPWVVLGIAAGASVSEIKKAYRTKMKEWHPDKNARRLQEAEEKSKVIIAAYVTLSSNK